MKIWISDTYTSELRPTNLDKLCHEFPAKKMRSSGESMRKNALVKLCPQEIINELALRLVPRVHGLVLEDQVWRNGLYWYLS